MAAQCRFQDVTLIPMKYHGNPRNIVGPFALGVSLTARSQNKFLVGRLCWSLVFCSWLLVAGHRMLYTRCQLVYGAPV